MLKAFIAEYNEFYKKSFEAGFKGDFDRFCAYLTEPSRAPSAELKERLNAINALFYEPLLVGVVGQFSSGKSSFLNAILGADILPTGVIPVTAKPTFIKYAPQSFLKALYEDGREEFFEISKLASFVDQRLDLKAVKALYIHLPNEILKQISFIDTPGLNSRSHKDTNETLEILEVCSGIIWLSLIDNAARAGELKELEMLPKRLKNHALCLLNQKDKLNENEITRVLEHCKVTYNKYFSAILPISAKLELMGDKNSGFDEIRKFLKAFDKEGFIKENMREIIDSMKSEQKRILGILGELESLILAFHKKYENFLEEGQNAYKSSFALIFDEIKNNAEFIAKLVMEHISEHECEFFKSKKNVFGQKIEKLTYKAQILNEQSALNALLYDNENVKKLFNKLKRNFSSLQDKIKADLSELFNELRESALDFKAKYESLQKADLLHSDLLYANIRQFSCDTYALFILHYEREIENKLTRLDLFFEKINIKISTNFLDALRLALSFISQKSQNQRKNFESDPLSFSLYFPSLNETKERILTELSYYEFEDEIVGSNPFISKFLRQILLNFDKIKEQNLELLNALKSKHLKELAELEKMDF